MTVAQVFSCEFCEIFKKTYFYRTPLVAAFEVKTEIVLGDSYLYNGCLNDVNWVCSSD